MTYSDSDTNPFLQRQLHTVCVCQERHGQYTISEKTYNDTWANDALPTDYMVSNMDHSSHTMSVELAHRSRFSTYSTWLSESMESNSDDDAFALNGSRTYIMTTIAIAF